MTSKHVSRIQCKKIQAKALNICHTEYETKIQEALLIRKANRRLNDNYRQNQWGYLKLSESHKPNLLLSPSVLIQPFQRCSTSNQCWAPQIFTLFRNRKFRKTALSGLQPQIRKFAVIFCSSATANDFLFPHIEPQTLLLFFSWFERRGDLRQ